MPESQLLPNLILKPREERRLREGHSWIYSNEVDSKKTPLKSFIAGEQVRVIDSKNKCLGIAIINPKTLICARLVSRNENGLLTKTLIKKRIKAAFTLRDQVYKKPCYRLVYGDSDLLPGLVIDRFNDICVVQIATAGMENVKDEIIEALTAVIQPRGILLKNDGKMRDVEGLETYVEVAFGEVPESAPFEENGVLFEAPIFSGQKTGWFYDHRSSRAELAHHVKGKRVLDVFSYIGGWGVQAAAFGASEVICIDASEQALEWAHKNAALNDTDTHKISESFQTIKGDAFDALKQLKNDGEKFDVIILDPPAFITRRKDHKNGLNAYRRANDIAMHLLKPDGLLVSGSCSLHLTREELVDVIRASARHIGKHAQIIHHGHQDYDHPIHAAIPETAYLKAVFARVID